MSGTARETSPFQPRRVRLAAAVDRIFVINLDRRRDRWDAFVERLPFTSGDGLERFPAVDGRDLEPSGGLVRLFRGNDFQYRRGVLGCALSHYRLWQRVADDDTLGDVLILEDDVLFAAGFRRAWSRRLPVSPPAGYDLAYLGGWPLTSEELDAFESGDESVLPAPDEYVREMIDPFFGVPRRTDVGTFAYLLSRGGAQKLCAHVEAHGFHRAVDYFLMDLWPRLRVCAAVPFLCWSAWEGSSDVQNDTASLFGETPPGGRE